MVKECLFCGDDRWSIPQGLTKLGQLVYTEALEFGSELEVFLPNIPRE